MFIPLHDANSLKRIKLQYVTIGLIAVNVLIYFFTAFGAEQFALAAVYGLGYIPSVVFDYVELPPELAVVPEDLTYISYAFLHGDLFHLGGNMLFLWVFGDNVEDALGHTKFLIFYLLCAVAGALLHGLVAPESQVPLIGASGAIAGVVAAYLILHPRVKIWILAFGRIPLRIPAYITLMLWILFQFAMFAIAGDDQVSFACHVGGILAGAVLVLILRSRDVPLFDREIVTPRAVVVEQPSAVRPVGVEPAPRWGRQ
ncbi:rhomboid family intramembrane serine protease [Mesorhizobium sp. KR9-304]|uniref:rhomboid family intramembrane serine protease n=1 Tax=Mesorhizobium sp. KR9-304 TaxID=3156614 RepID=UPI0032B5BCD9